MNPSTTSTLLDAQDDTYRFTATELARLAAYRAAVRAGFYNDRGAETAQTITTAVATADTGVLEREDCALRGAGFTPAEITRLVAYRDAVAAGLFRDTGEQAATAASQAG